MNAEHKPWIKGYKLGPFELNKTMVPYPAVPLYRFLDDTAERYSSRPACFYLGRKITYKELKLEVDKLSCALSNLGVKKGDKVASILPTSPQFVISDYAIQKAGAVHVPCSLLHKSHDLIWEIGESGARTVICLDTHLDVVKSIRPETNIKDIIVTSIHDYSAEESKVTELSGALQLRDLINMSEPQPPQIDVDPDQDLALLVFTGGATGKPKGVMLTHSNLTANTMQSLPWVLGPLEKGIKGKASMLIGVPTFHSYGHWAIRACVYWGLQMLMVPDPRDIDMIVELLKKFRPFMAPLVPTQYMRLVDKKIGRSNTTFSSGAAPLPPEVAHKFKKVTGMPITEAYGLSETGPLSHFNLSSFAKITGFMPFEKNGSIGVPVADTEVKVVNGDRNSEVAEGEVGELYIRGPQVMKGYWPTIGNGLENGWLPTGDLCRMDEDGYFYLVDRNKDMINVSGNKVYSTRVDEVLFEHPAISQAVSIGIPDDSKPGSERVKAFIVLKEEAKGTIRSEEIIAHCNTKLPPYAVPKLIEFRESLPLTVTQKLFKKALRDEELKKIEMKKVQSGKGN